MRLKRAFAVIDDRTGRNIQPKFDHELVKAATVVATKLKSIQTNLKSLQNQYLAHSEARFVSEKERDFHAQNAHIIGLALQIAGRAD